MVHEGCDRAGYNEQGDFELDYNSPKRQVKIGCWGPVVNCNVPKRSWMAGIYGCPKWEVSASQAPGRPLSI